MDISNFFIHDTSDSALGPDYSIKCKQVDGFRKHSYGVWQGIVHPSGVLYYFDVSMKTYTGSDVKKYTPNQLNNLQNWIRAARRRLQEETWYMVVKPVTREDRDYYEYYCVVPDARIIAWFEDFNADLLFQECAFAREWNHKSKARAGGTILHIDFFPRHYIMQRSDATELRAHLEWYLAEGLILEQSTAASLFWSTDQTEKVIARLISFENLLNSDASLKEQGVAYCGRIWNILRHHQFLNYYGFPEARLMRTHSIEGSKRNRNIRFLSLLSTAAMFGVPVMVLEHVEKLHVDGIVNLLDIKKFLDHFNDDNIKHSTLAGVIMAVDASILAIPNIGSQVTTRTLCSLSLILSVHCIFAGVVAQHFGQKMKSLQFASHNLQYHFTKVAIIYSAPMMNMCYSIA
ncbi:uncharacterized protein HD556DRAFT_1445409 [Suillus plorans]|uniref:Uncharacterized protein n=1 Tax=Suillus plorans TaxID=116603 RepID=A0A9P7A8L1_9AGAM|nr:uncharacterized protein HD556DRAFT_1451707 [Suillus plorans]XP_041158039.1 uncharacterized protein HD556DRAFT_1445409 [Suillus plorans]KAG1784510.1 hypothetical protein HD556DRAFT_1451707 [Suillus plorans]KAG1791154.1 hypothetical protein HD556DRAFT_1445409 [Suillus plorans]